MNFICMRLYIRMSQFKEITEFNAFELNDFYLDKKDTALTIHSCTYDEFHAASEYRSI